MSSKDRSFPAWTIIYISMETKTSTRPIDLNNPFVSSVLPLLLQDMTTGRNILWGTNSFCHPADSEIQLRQLSDDVIIPRAEKALETRTARTRDFAEVFTPTWICNRMNNHADESWFGRRNVFNKEQGKTWSKNENPVFFPEGKTWKDYVDSRRLEITCGEAPYLTSRYNAADGELIPFRNRVGLLDRKLRVVNENTEDEQSWFQWTVRAYQSVYGYEFQGDNLLIARINLLMTFIECLADRWNRGPDKEELAAIAYIIAWNIWQMDGFTNTIPFCEPTEYLLDLFEEGKKEDSDCLIRVWSENERMVKYRSIKGKNRIFDLATGNPPYQGKEKGNGRPAPIYDRFMETTFQVAKAAILITPARFLFNAGLTSKAWNAKMLYDDHFKVMDYYDDAEEIFDGTEIKGGVAITYRDLDRRNAPIKTFFSHQELDGIVTKVCSRPDFIGLDTIVSARGMYRLTEEFFRLAPYASERLGKKTGNMMVSNILEKIPEMFTETPVEEDDLSVYGRIGNERVRRYIRRRLVIRNEFVDTYNLMVPKSNGSGRFGETLTMPVILNPGEIATDTFISIGKFRTRSEAEVMERYYCSKFFRAMLGVNKVTQDNPPSVWRMIPLLNFDAADLKDQKRLDPWLYREYDLSEEEIKFIEENVNPQDGANNTIDV